MIYKNIGNDKVPAIANGITKVRDVEERINTIKYGISQGLTFIDTAELYGNGISEEVVGKSIKGFRDDIFLSSKFNHNESTNISNSLNNSLERLHTDYIDLYQVHFPNPNISINKTMNELSKFVDDGKIRYIGLSNFSVQEFDIAQLFTDKKIVSNQLEYNLLDRSPEDNFISLKKDVTLIAYSPLNQGRLIHNCEQKILLKKLSEKYNRSIAQIILRWIIEKDNVIPIIKTENITRINENLNSLEFRLEKKDITLINNLSKNNIEYIPQKNITPNIYETLDDAIENKLNLIPSPVNLAKIIKEYNLIKPIRIIEYKNGIYGKYYMFDKYDIMDQVKKYWAWIIAYGYNIPIPTFIMNDSL